MWVVVELDVNQVDDTGPERAFGPYNTEAEAKNVADAMSLAPVGYLYFVIPLEGRA